MIVHIDQVMPQVPYSDPEFAAKAAALFEADGTALADALWESLPGGTIDALLSNLFARKASQFRVRFPQEASR